MSSAWALTRFQVEGYVRSFRALPPLLVALLLVAVTFQVPAGPLARQPDSGSLGDMPALMFPIWAWLARSLLDTEPDGQRDLSAVAVGRPTVRVVAGLLSAYLLNAAIAVVVMAPHLYFGGDLGFTTAQLLGGLMLALLSALAATVFGALTSRAVLPSPAISILVLVGGCLGILLLSMTPLSVLTLPMIEWLRAAHESAAAFTAVVPGVAVHILAWSVVVGAAYTWLRRRRP